MFSPVPLWNSKILVNNVFMKAPHYRTKNNIYDCPQPMENFYRCHHVVTQHILLNWNKFQFQTT